jgi:hypothetical protein
MSGKMTRYFYNNLCSGATGIKHLEIGVLLGSILAAAMSGNTFPLCRASGNGQRRLAVLPLVSSVYQWLY